jgi:hypothetical protein
MLACPRYETIRRCHVCSGVLLLFPKQRASKPEVAGGLKAGVRFLALSGHTDANDAPPNVRYWGKAEVTRTGREVS